MKLKEVQGQNETLRRIIRTMKPPAQAGEAAAALSKLHNRLPLQARGKQQHMQAQAQTQTNGNEQAANEQARAEGGGQDAAPAAVST